jgi:hypothetical protein
MRYSVAGRSLATAATANHVGAQLWNPSTSLPVWVRELHWFQTGAVVSNPAITRSSARGATPTATVTPDIDNHYDRALAPPSGVVLELATFGTQPTIDTVPLARYNQPAAAGSGFILVFGDDGIEVKPGTGLVVATLVAVILQPADVTVVWEE